MYSRREVKGQGMKFAPQISRVRGRMICVLFSVFCFLSSVFCLADEFVYDSKGKRDPFIPLVGPGAIHQIKGALEVRSIEDVVVEGIVYDPKGGSMVIINGMPLKEGDQIGVALVDKIEPKQVRLLIEEKPYEVTLDAEKGR